MATQVVSEETLVEQLAEVAQAGSYRVKSHRLTVDHEEDRKSLVVTFIQGDPRQGKLPLGGGELPAGEEGEE